MAKKLYGMLYTRENIAGICSPRNRSTAPISYYYNLTGRIIQIDDKEFPEWYLPVYIYHTHGWIRAKGVKYLIYSPNYLVNHLYKDDFLYISYDKPIVVDERYYKSHGCEVPDPKENPGRQLWYTGYNLLLYGPDIVSFAKAVKKYSCVEGIDEILERMDDKVEWFRETYPEENRWRI